LIPWVTLLKLICCNLYFIVLCFVEFYQLRRSTAFVISKMFRGIQRNKELEHQDHHINIYNLVEEIIGDDDGPMETLICQN
jgi:hypothetical protein